MRPSFLWLVWGLSSALGTLGFAQSSPTSSADDPVQSRKTVLVLGDSISIGYTPSLAEQLADIATVVRPMINDNRAENCSGTRNGVVKVDEWIARFDSADVITFNFGLHDLKRESRDQQGRAVASNDSSDPPQSDPETYRKNLLEIVKKLEATGAKLFFVTTTPVPPGGVRPHRDFGDPLLYNGIARQVVEPRGIEVIDLNAIVSENLDWMRPANVHFTPEGSQHLAAAIAKPVREALENLDQARQTQVDPEDAPSWTADPVVVAKKSQAGPYNYDETKVPSIALPDPLVMSDGRSVGAEQWQARREETLELFRDHVYGHVPEAAGAAEITFEPVDQYDGVRVKASQVEARIKVGDDTFSFPFLVYLPKAGSSETVGGQVNQSFPAIVVIQNRTYPDLVGLVEHPSSFVPVEAITKRGYAVAVFHTKHVDPDRKDGFDDGIRGFFARAALGPEAGIADRKPTDWGSIAAWGWGASRVLDYLESLPEIDPLRVAVIGHSRGGKTAAWAAANDTRFVAAMINSSGCGGAALSRRSFGETVDRITTSFPHWFAGSFSDYAGAEDRLPVDQHQLIGLIAPRAVAISSAAEDLWADPRGEYLSLVHAAPVFSLLGHKSISDPEMPPLGQPRVIGKTGYIIRPGIHNLHEGDWTNYLDFLDRQLK